MNIEKFFLINLLRITFLGTGLILFTDILYAEDPLSITIDAVIFSACIFAFVVRRWSDDAAVLIVTIITLAAMNYQWIQGANIVTSMAVILIIGFIFSILLRGKLMWFMHGLAAMSVFVAIYAQKFIVGNTPPSNSEMITASITYYVLYFIISYSTAILKLRYDENNLALRKANDELHTKAEEIEAQHEELLQSHDNVNEMNRNLEKIVMERTAKVHAQNEMLLKYTFTNAHQLRAPVARLLGLISIRKLDVNPDNNFFFTKVEDQANEIDTVVKQINAELEKEQ
jgi:hypothetical protein